MLIWLPPVKLSKRQEAVMIWKGRRQQINGEMKLKGLLTFEKKYFNLNVLLYQHKVLELGSSEITPIKHQI